MSGIDTHARLRGPNLYSREGHLVVYELCLSSGGRRCMGLSYLHSFFLVNGVPFSQVPTRC